MKRHYWYVIIVYLLMQFSTYIGVPLFLWIAMANGAEKTPELVYQAGAYWIVVSFLVGLLITLFLMRKDMKEKDLRGQAPVSESIGWAIGGIFLAMAAQMFAAYIEQLLGQGGVSGNTQQIVELVSVAPLMIVATSIIGPILEEIIFRKIIFGSLYKRLGFFLSALISSLIFGAAHGEFSHILVYTAMGFVFSFLYIKTNRILVPIFAHVSMNTLVVLMQFVNRDEIQKILEKEQLQIIIGGLL